MTIDVAIKHLNKDKKLAKIIKEFGMYKIRVTRNKYKSLVEAIITQQLSGPAAKTISTRFKALYDVRFPTPAKVIDTPNAKLRKTGLSKTKVGYIKDLSKRIESKDLRLERLPRLSDEEIIDELTKVRGIGRWTAEMFLIFTLGRMDVLPVGDLGVKKGIMMLHSMSELPSEKYMIDIAEKWRPYRTVATWYLWKSLKNFDPTE